MRKTGSLHTRLGLVLALLGVVFIVGVGVKVQHGLSRREAAVPPRAAPPAAPTGQKKPPAPPQPSRAWKLAFVREGDVWVAHGDGTGQKLLLKNGGSPCWSPDKKQIAFARDGNVWVAQADGSGQRPLTFRWKKDEPDQYQYWDGRTIDISWDLKANSITFSHWEEFQVRRVENKTAYGVIGYSLFDVPVYATQGRELFVRFDLYDDETFFHFSHHGHPAWSKSGQWLAFVRNGDIWIADRGFEFREKFWREMSLRLWDVTRLAAVASYDAPTYRGSRENYGVTHLSWSPDEKSIAYGIRRLRGSGFWEIHLLRLGSDEYGRLVVQEDRTLAGDGEDPCFSPDGKFIAYLGESPGDGLTDILVVSTDGQVKKRLIEGAEQPAW